MDKQPSSLLEHKPCPELAEALRSRSERIIQMWSEAVREITPSAKTLPLDQLIDNLPKILPRMADALATGNGRGLIKLAEVSPAQGISRFHLNFDVRALMQEDRVLRRMIIEEIGAVIGRLMTQDEQVALHICIDEMAQNAVAAFVDQQNATIRSGAETELKYLSFLSHDLHNNLGSVTLFLQVLRQRLAEVPEFAQDVATLDQTQESIRNTIGGMERLIQNERLRKAGVTAKHALINLHRLALNINQPMLPQAERKGLKLAVEIPANAVVSSDGELITLVLQNLIGNAIKYSAKGVVRISAKQESDRRWSLSVSDEGPGIAREHLARIFEAFKRGDSHGQPGVGLGLAIASQAAKLLGAELTVESTIGIGSKFRLLLPAEGEVTRGVPSGGA